MKSPLPYSRRSFFALAAPVLALAFAPFANAQETSVLRPRIEAALNSIQTQKGRFIQIDTVSGLGLQGEFSISRPGRLRFEYDQKPELLIADGSHLARINTRTGGTNLVRLDSTPLRVLLVEVVDLTNGVTITSMEQTPDSLFVTLYQTGKRNQGLLTIFLDLDTYELRGWKIEENDGGITTVILQETQRDVYIDPNTYEIPESGLSND